MERRCFLPVSYSQAVDLSLAETLLYFPTCHIDIDQYISFGDNLCRSMPVDDYQSGRSFYLFPAFFYFVRIQEVCIVKRGTASKKAIVCQIRTRHLLNIFYAFKTLIRMNHQRRMQYCQVFSQFFRVYTMITFNDNDLSRQLFRDVTYVLQLIQNRLPTEGLLS